MANILDQFASRLANPFARPSAPIRAVLKTVQRGPIRELRFALNPSDIVRTRQARYGVVPIALADNDGLDFGGGGAEEIQIQFALDVEFRIEGSTQPGSADDVEDDLTTLDQFMLKDTRNQEPPDLYFVMGKKQDKVRILNKQVHEVLHTTDLRVSQAEVRLTMRTVEIRR